MAFSLEDSIPPHILRDIVKKMNVKTVVRLNLGSCFGNMVANSFGADFLNKYLEALEVTKEAKTKNMLCCPVPENITLLQDLLSDKRRYGDYLEKELASCLDHCFIDVQYTWARVVELEKTKQLIEILQQKLYYLNILHNDCFHLREKTK